MKQDTQDLVVEMLADKVKDLQQRIDSLLFENQDLATTAEYLKREWDELRQKLNEKEPETTDSTKHYDFARYAVVDKDDEIIGGFYGYDEYGWKAVIALKAKLDENNPSEAPHRSVKVFCQYAEKANNHE